MAPSFLPLPGLAWVEVQSSAVEVDRRREVLSVAETRGFRHLRGRSIGRPASGRRFRGSLRGLLRFVVLIDDLFS